MNQSVFVYVDSNAYVNIQVNKNKILDLSGAQDVTKQTLKHPSPFSLIINDLLHLLHYLGKLHQPLPFPDVLSKASLHVVPALPQGLWQGIGYRF